VERYPLDGTDEGLSWRRGVERCFQRENRNWAKPSPL
jgi:hypothetical protein